MEGILYSQRVEKNRRNGCVFSWNGIERQRNLKIVNIDMTGPYTEGMTYQENIIPGEQVKLGHDVSLWVSCYCYKDGKEVAVPEEEKIMEDGVRLRRFLYVNYGNEFINKKLRNIRGIYARLEKMHPDIIMQHDAHTMVTSQICRYVEKHPKVKYIIDSHTDHLNSAKTFLSKYLLHRCIYKRYVRMAYDNAETVYCISPEVKKFLVSEYSIKKDKFRFLPLGSTVPDDEWYQNVRSSRRKELGIDDNTTLFVHSGKLTPMKKTSSILRAMEGVTDKDCRLIIIGSADEELEETIREAEKKDPRIQYLGWMDGTELREWLCAGDVYVSPGSQSNTVQTAMCCREAVLVYPYDNYKTLMKGTGAFVTSVKDISYRMNYMAQNLDGLRKMKESAYKYADEYLNYAKQARILAEM